MSENIYRALIVDDEPLVREATSRAMGKSAFWCDTACDGVQALQMCRESKYDLVVTDLRMPKMHGPALIAELLNVEPTPHVVVLTGVAEPLLVKHLITLGVDDIVNKPVGYSVFAAKMQSFFSRAATTSSTNTTGASGFPAGGKQVVTSLENDLMMFSDCVPEPLNEKFSAAEQAVNAPPENISIFMKRLAGKRTPSPEQRQSRRISLFTTAVAVPVDKDFNIQGDGFKMTMLDLSENGACLINTRMVYHKYLALRWPSMISPALHLQAVMELVRVKPMGPFYEVAGEFVVHD